MIRSESPSHCTFLFHMNTLEYTEGGGAGFMRLTASVCYVTHSIFLI